MSLNGICLSPLKKHCSNIWKCSFSDKIFHLLFKCPIVERLTNSMMMHGRNNGKKLMTVRIVKHAFEIIHLLTGENPVQVLVDAIINSGPREDSTRIGRAGTVRRQAVDVAPLRRVNQAIWLLCTGAREAAFRNIKTIAECLADELINASKVSQILIYLLVFAFHCP